MKIFNDQQAVFFKDRQSAGKLLAERLTSYQNKFDVLVLAIPRGGVVVASEIAKVLNLPLDIVITRKIGAPSQPELALGALDPKGRVIWDRQLMDDLGFKIDDLEKEVENQLKEIERRELEYRQNRKPLNVKGKIVILVDDGVATGATMLSALKYLKSLGAKRVVVAVPVIAKEVMEKISGETDEMVVLSSPEFLGAVGSFYQDFAPVEDEEVTKLLVDNQQ